jgi:hypothetical protein
LYYLYTKQEIFDNPPLKEGRVKPYHGIVAFAFGVPDTISSNRRIAEIASEKARELKAPIYTQFDVPIEQGIEVEYADEDEHGSNPPPTLRIARKAVQWAKQRGLRRLWITAAKPHMWRCRRDLNEAVREAGAEIQIHICLGIERYPDDSWFCPDSEQERVRSGAAWNKRERILKIMPFCVYKLIAS